MYRFILPAMLLVAAPAALSRDTAWQQRQAARDQADLDKQLQGLVPGKPQNCLSQTRFVHDSSRVGDTILYKVSRREIYRTDTSGGCFGLRRGDTIVTKSTTGQLCRGDIIETVDLPARIRSGSCTFGAFIPYRKP